MPGSGCEVYVLGYVFFNLVSKVVVISLSSYNCEALLVKEIWENILRTFIIPINHYSDSRL